MSTVPSSQQTVQPVKGTGGGDPFQGVCLSANLWHNSLFWWIRRQSYKNFLINMSLWLYLLCIIRWNKRFLPPLASCAPLVLNRPRTVHTRRCRTWNWWRKWLHSPTPWFLICGFIPSSVVMSRPPSSIKVCCKGTKSFWTFANLRTNIWIQNEDHGVGSSDHFANFWTTPNETPVSFYRRIDQFYYICLTDTG